MDIRIIRSTKRRKTVQARKVGGTLEILAPAGLSDEQLQPHIRRLADRIARRDRSVDLDDCFLEERATELNRRYFNDRLKFHSIRWSHTQKKSFGSCTPSLGTIHISARLSRMPRFVLEYVIVHELAHLRERGHGKRFWSLVNRYAKTERARGYLMAAGMDDVEPIPEGDHSDTGGSVGNPHLDEGVFRQSQGSTE
ncbi:MAG: M48 family metallopeptidase [Planctomycetes bacterium]|nr:M48 family metallopeptidase [Planctomycetota bacterium]